MKLKVKKLKPVVEEVVEKPKSTPKATKPKAEPKSNKKDNKLPSDEYKPMFPPMRILVKETPSHQNCTKLIRQYLELSVKRFGEDEVNQPMVYVQMYQESDFYTGYLKGKTIYLPLEMLYDFIDTLNDISEECDKRHIE